MSRLVPPSSVDGASTTGLSVWSARVNTSVVTSGVSGRSTASTSAASPVASSSAWRIAFASGGFSSRTAWAPRSRAISSTASSGDMTQVSQPDNAWVTSITSSSMARVSAPRSIGESTGARRDLVSESDLTGSTIARTKP